MNDTQKEATSYKKRWALSFGGAIGGMVIGELARQMVQVGQVSLVRLVALILCSLVVGGMIGFEIASRRLRAASD